MTRSFEIIFWVVFLEIEVRGTSQVPKYSLFFRLNKITKENNVLNSDKTIML